MSDYAYLLAMLKTSPLTVTLGLSLTIPCALLGDLFVGNRLGGWETVLGATLVLVSFVVVGLADKRDAEALEGDAVEAQ